MSVTVDWWPSAVQSTWWAGQVAELGGEERGGRGEEDGRGGEGRGEEGRGRDGGREGRGRGEGGNNCKVAQLLQRVS